MIISHNPELPSGSIVLWYGNAANVPAGWQVCDGTNGTPNLQNQYVKGNDADGNLGAVGGNLTHSHTVNAHSHNIPADAAIAAGTDYAAATDQQSPGTNSPNHEPPYTKVYYIMKL